MDRDKRELRKLKREIKRAGNKRRRRHLKRELEERPEDAPHTEFDFGRYSSTPFNALDHDATRRRQEEGNHETHERHEKKSKEKKKSEGLDH